MDFERLRDILLPTILLLVVLIPILIAISNGKLALG